MALFDVVIPCHPKDSDSLARVIKSLDNLSNKRNIYVISPEPITLNIKQDYHVVADSVFDDLFTISQIKNRWEKEDDRFSHRASWVYQQLLKIFCYQKINDLTDSYFSIDADSIILRDMKLNTDKFQYCITPTENRLQYKAVYKNLTGMNAQQRFSFVYHHMMFKKSYLSEYILHVEKLHKTSFIKALLNSMSYDNQSPCCVDWEAYANWVYTNHPEICERRNLKYKRIDFVPNEQQIESMSQSFDMISCHAWMRDKNK